MSLIPHTLQELRYVEDDLYRTKNTLHSRVKDREEEIQKLRNQVGLWVPPLCHSACTWGR